MVSICYNHFETYVAYMSEFHLHLSSSQTRVHEDWCELESDSLHKSRVQNKSCMAVDGSWEARVYMRVFSTLVSQSFEEQELHESWWEWTGGNYRSIDENLWLTLIKIWTIWTLMRVNENWWSYGTLVSSHRHVFDRAPWMHTTIINLITACTEL